MVWVYLLNLPGPPAMIPMIPTFACFLAISIAIYHLFPADWRQEPAFVSIGAGCLHDCHKPRQASLPRL